MNFKIYNVLFCVLVVSAQCVASRESGPETISCAKDELPVEFRASQRRERIFFSVKRPGLGLGDKLKIQDIQAFDLSQGAIEDIFLDFPIGQGRPLLSPSETHFVFRERIRSEERRDEIFVYQRPIIRAVDSQANITVPLEILSDDVLDWSPDGKCLVIISKQRSLIGMPEIGLYHLANGQYESWQLPRNFNPTTRSPLSLLSPDGRWLAGQCGQDLCVTNANGEIVYQSPVETGFEFLKWSPDSQYLLVGEGKQGGGIEVSYLEAGSDWVKRSFGSYCQGCNYFFNFFVYDWSPDASKLAVQISEGMLRHLEVIEFPSGQSYDPGIDLGFPVWSPDGSQLAGTKLSDDYRQPKGIYKMRPDGSDLELITEIKSGEEAYVLFWTSGE